MRSFSSLLSIFLYIPFSLSLVFSLFFFFLNRSSLGSPSLVGTWGNPPASASLVLGFQTCCCVLLTVSFSSYLYPFQVMSYFTPSQMLSFNCRKFRWVHNPFFQPPNLIRQKVLLANNKLRNILTFFTSSFETFHVCIHVCLCRL